MTDMRFPVVPCLALAAFLAALLLGTGKGTVPEGRGIAHGVGMSSVQEQASQPLPVSLFPRARDYTLSWWAYGWRGRSPDGRKVLCFQTGQYGMALDVERLEMLHLGRIARARPYSEAVAQDNKAVFSLPNAALGLSVRVGDKVYRCVRGAVNQKDWLNYPVRLIDGGRFVQRVDILQLAFEDAQGNPFEGDGRLEIVAWPDRLSLLLEVTPRRDLAEATLEAEVRPSGGAWETRNVPAKVKPWPAGERRTAWVSVSPGPARREPEEPDMRLTAAPVRRPGETARVEYDGARGWHTVHLPKEDWQPERDLDHLDRVAVRLSNPADREQTVRLQFAREEPFPGITGLTPMLRDREGNPTGIPVQVSKNWHRAQDRTFLYEGPWFHGYTMLHLPPKSSTTLELTIAYGRWGGVPAASHAQLCLIGWGMNQLWDQAAIGSWGESITYDPDVNLNRAMFDDVRPLMVTAMGTRDGRWSWTNNVGGGDFLVYFDEHGIKQYLSRMKTAYLSHGPNLTRVVYAGVTADGRIAARIEVSSPRCDDVNRAFHRIRYDVLKPAPFTRLAFYQVGADSYNDHQFERLARGDTRGLVEEWTFPKGGKRYDRVGIPCEGDSPWFSLHRAVSRDERGGAWANRGLVIRSWRARLGGKRAPFPFAACYGTEDGIPGMNVEIAPPPGLRELLPGDFVEADVELAIMPVSAVDYYGPNEGLRAALRSGGNTWQPILREAAGNHLRIQALRGKIQRRLPLAVQVDAGQAAEVEIAGGVGYVPITFEGLDGHRGYTLRRSANGKDEAVDQAIHGNDFWQTEYDAARRKWKRTYNIPLDGPDGHPQVTRITFQKTREGSPGAH